MEIYNNADTILLQNDLQTRQLIKAQVKEIALVRDTIIKIDIGLGPLSCIYIDSATVTEPPFSSPEDLRDQLITYLAGPMDQVQSQLATLNLKQFYEATIVDDTTPGVTYKGYALPGKTDVTKPYWAIEQIKVVGSVTSSYWANGNQNMDKIWNNKETYTYGTTGK